MASPNRSSGYFLRARQALALAFCVVIAACSGGGGGGGGGSSGVAIVPPAISVQPQSATANDGSPATFSVGVTGSAPFVYQWSRSGTDVAGATGASYTIPNAQLSDNAASFTVTVRNAAGSVQSAAATLSVTPVAPAIVNNVATTVPVLAGSSATLRVSTTGSLPMTFQWRRAGVAIAGATSSTYTTPATTLADNGATYDVVVSNVAGSVTSALFTLAVTNAPVAPTISVQPQSQTTRIGDSAVFTVTASGTGTLTYQWARNGTPIAGAVGTSYTLANTMLTDNAAQFTVTVANAVGSVVSNAATLTVLPQAGIALVAGDIGGPGAIDATGTSARFTAPAGAAYDAAGNLFVADGSTVRRVSSTGAVVTVAGSPLQSGSADGTAGAARFNQPSGVAVDAGGNVFVVDKANNTIRRITSAGVVTTFAGTAGVVGAADGNGAVASFRAPSGLTIDTAGNLYVADSGNHTIRRITPTGDVTTVAGTAGTAGSADGTGNGAQFRSPQSIAIDGSGRLYVADTGNQTVRVVTSAGVVTTLAGTAGVAGALDGTGAGASFSSPSGIAVDAAGNAYVGETGNLLVRRVTQAGVVTTVAGTVNVAGSTDGSGAAARFRLPVALAVDASGTVIVADRDNFAIRKVTPAGAVSTFAGAAIVQGSADGAAGVATFNTPFGVAVDASGTIYVADYFNATIRRITALGTTTTLAGVAGATGYADGAGAAARFVTPQGIAVDTAGNVYVADKSAQTIRKISPTGVVTTLAGSPTVRGSADGTGAAASFNDPAAVAVDAAGVVYVVDNGPTVRRITPAGVVTTIAGGAGRVGAVDGPGSVASFRFPQGITVDAAGNLYVADAGNAVIRKITSAGVVSTIAGTAGATGTVDGQGGAARFTLPTGIAVDASGIVFVADLNGHAIRRIDTAGNVTTVVGTADGLRGVRLGALPGHLDLPVQLAVDANGNLYCTDDNGVLRITFR